MSQRDRSVIRWFTKSNLRNIIRALGGHSGAQWGLFGEPPDLCEPMPNAGEYLNPTYNGNELLNTLSNARLDLHHVPLEIDELQGEVIMI